MTFSDFNAVSKAEWLAKIEKDLKGRPLSELTWQLGNLTIDPFAHADDWAEQPPMPITDGSQRTNSWLIGEDIDCQHGNVVAANQQALEALMGGTQALCFNVKTYPTIEVLSTLLKDIFLEYVALYFYEITGVTNPLNFLEILTQYADNQGFKPQQLRGGIQYDPLNTDSRLANTTVQDLVRVVQYAKTQLPLWSVIIVRGGHFFTTPERVVDELTQLLTAGSRYIKALTNAGLPANDIADRIAFEIHIGTYFFIEIAKLRAFKILWANVLKAYNAEPKAATIYAFVTTATQTPNEHDNKIRATTQAMSAVIGGVNCLTIAPSDAAITTESSKTNRRIARNVQHLLQLESHFDRVIDPAAGSYYIEKLTAQIADAAWKQFCQNSTLRS